MPSRWLTNEYIVPVQLRVFTNYCTEKICPEVLENDICPQTVELPAAPLSFSNSLLLVESSVLPLCSELATIDCVLHGYLKEHSVEPFEMST